MSPEGAQNALSGPPRDIDAERATLGSMLHGATWLGEVLAVVAPRDFYEPRHETLFSVIVEMYTANKPVDPVTLAGELARRGELDKIGGAPYLFTLSSSPPSPANGPWYAQRVTETAVLRRMVTAGTRIRDMGYAADTSDLAQIRAAAQAELDRVRGDESERERGIAEIFAEVLDSIENPAKETALSSGLRSLDDVYRGGGPGRLDVIAGRPGSGKSLLGTNILRHVSIRRGIPSQFFSLEMPAADIMQRIISAEARVSLNRIVDPQREPPTPEDWARIAAIAPRVTQAPFEIKDKPVGLAQVAREVRMAVKRGVRVVFIDYLQLMANPRGAESRQVAVSANIDGLKALALDLGIWIVCLAQLNRGPTTRTDGVPRLSDLRESGSIEQSADCVILIHRPDMELPESPRAGEADLIVAKQRNGRTGIATVAFRGHYAQFNDFAPDYA